MNADVHHRAAAGQGTLEHPVGAEVGEAVVAAEDAEVIERADPAGVDRALEELHRRVVAMIETDREGAPRRPRRIEDAPARLDGVRQRLFAQHVLARRERGERHLLVQVHRRRDDDRVDVWIFDERSIVGMARAPLVPVACAALARSASATPTSFVLRFSMMERARSWPMTPAPTTATFIKARIIGDARGAVGGHSLSERLVGSRRLSCGRLASRLGRAGAGPRR